MEREAEKIKNGPRFHRDIKITPTPEGMVLVKFHGKPAFIPAKEEGELMYNRDFTARQADALIEFEHRRLSREPVNLDLTIYD